MAVVKATIKAALLALYTSAEASPMTRDDFADEMADIIRDAILSATITVTSSGAFPGTGRSRASDVKVSPAGMRATVLPFERVTTPCRACLKFREERTLSSESRR